MQCDSMTRKPTKKPRKPKTIYSKDNWRLQYKEMFSRKNEMQPKQKTINNMPVSAIEKLLRNPRTPKHLKTAWRKRLKEFRKIMAER